MRETEAKWVARVADWRESGKSAEEYAAVEGSSSIPICHFGLRPSQRRWQCISSPSHAAGIDIGSTMHAVAVPTDLDSEAGANIRHLHRLADWLVHLEVTTIAMESTGVYWIPMFALHRELLATYTIHRSSRRLIMPAPDIHPRTYALRRLWAGRPLDPAHYSAHLRGRRRRTRGSESSSVYAERVNRNETLSRQTL